MSYCDVCGYPAPCGREHWWLDQEMLFDESQWELAHYCRSCKRRMKEPLGWSNRFCQRCRERQASRSLPT
jgi:hypothetical protein